MSESLKTRPEPEGFPSWQDYAKAEHQWFVAFKKQLRERDETSSFVIKDFIEELLGDSI